ncbi:MAG: aspartate carbamoyltransferase [Acidimicrobiia bacterium]
MVNNSGSPKHILSVNDLTSSQIEKIFSRAKEFKNSGFSSSEIFNIAPGNEPVVALAFFEPSTRTKLSFDAAAQRIGCKTIGFDNPEQTSSAKGEQLEDTLRVIEKYSDLIVIRRKSHDTVDVIREHVKIPVISAGVGAQEHPTQGLLDLFTIAENRSIESVEHLCTYGDLVNSRTMYSQVRLLAREGITCSFVASDDMQIPAFFVEELEAKGVKVIQTNSLDDVVSDLDVIQVIRPQRERWEGKELNAYEPIDEKWISKMKSDALIMHPLPRTGELDPVLDNDSRVVVWDQVENGMYVRAALLEYLLT